MRIVHISDLHFWRISWKPWHLMGKRLLGMGNLTLNRAQHYRLERIPDLLDYIRRLEPDHLLITGDLTTTSLTDEFEAAREGLEPLTREVPTTVIPGNHDRYTWASSRRRDFERYFGQFATAERYPWIKRLGPDTGILALDPCHPNPLSAIGTIGPAQLEQAARLLEAAAPRFQRLIVACHYPVAIPPGIEDSWGHGLSGVDLLLQFLSRHRPCLYCHGHIHAAWVYALPSLPGVLCCNPGAAIKRLPRSGVDCSLLEIECAGEDVTVHRHLLRRGHWESILETERKGFFAPESDSIP